MKLEYTLTQAEILEGLRCIGTAQEGKVRQINLWVMIALSALFIVQFLLNSATPHYLLVALLLVIATLTVLYLPDLKRRRTAARLSKVTGNYRMEFSAQTLKAEGTPFLVLSDPQQRIYESTHVYALFLNRRYHFCIPKRVLSAQEQKQLHTLFATCSKFRQL